MRLAIEWLPSCDPPPQLLILLPEPGAGGESMRPLAQALRGAFADAAILAPDAETIADLDVALDALGEWVGETQRRLRADPAVTALAGFGQGATLALELTARHDGGAGRVLAFGGRFARLPQAAPQATTLHLLHGGADPVVEAAEARRTLRHLGVLHGDATLDIAEGVGHELHPALIDAALHRLRTYIPQRTWRAALGAAPPACGQLH